MGQWTVCANKDKGLLDMHVFLSKLGMKEPHILVLASESQFLDCSDSEMGI